MPLETLSLRLKQNGYRPDISYGAFDEGAMVGLWLSGIRAIGGRKVACCTGATVLEEWRKRGIAGALAGAAEGAARALGASVGVLNARAEDTTVIRLYRGMGFEQGRTLHSYTSAALQAPLERNPMKARAVDIGHAYSLRHMLDHDLPWCKMWEGILAVKDSITAVAVSDGLRQRAYGLFQPATGRILHVGLDSADEEEGRFVLGAMIAFFMKVPDRTEDLELFQVPDSAGRIPAIMSSLGFALANAQLEMTKIL
ncbi:MAG: GNAT family N-acetyltransferase [Proteobacteria bacterium]|nr:GNAT family N-acetyltransferase [Pseudomonadota bacterium]